MRNTRSLTLIATLLVVVTLLLLGCKSAPHGAAQGVAIDEAVIADVMGDCDGTASADELSQLQSYFSQHSAGWFVGALPVTWEGRDGSEVSTDVLLEFFGRHQLDGPYESEDNLRNAHQVALMVHGIHVGIYVIENDDGYTITRLYRAGSDQICGGAWQEIMITSLDTLSVSLGEEFVLHERQCAAIEGVDLVVEVVAFYNSPCPDGMECDWSGVGIQFRYRHAGEVQAGTTLVQAFGYQTTILDTDHETFVRLTITRM